MDVDTGGGVIEWSKTDLIRGKNGHRAIDAAEQRIKIDAGRSHVGLRRIIHPNGNAIHIIPAKVGRDFKTKGRIAALVPTDVSAVEEHIRHHGGAFEADKKTLVRRLARYLESCAIPTDSLVVTRAFGQHIFGIPGMRHGHLDPAIHRYGTAAFGRMNIAFVK